MKVNISLISAFIISTISLSASAQHQSFVHANQIGYAANESKTAMITDLNENKFTIKNASTDADVYKGILTKAKFWRESNEDVAWADFSDFKTPGSYYIKVGSDRTFNFDIKEKGVYDELLVWTTKGFYLWRSGMDIEKQYATFHGKSFARKAGHPDTVCYLHPSVATVDKHADTEMDCHGGWYDAGDYGKYTVNAAISLHSLLTAYEAEREIFDTLNLNIPESNNSTPDILDECMYELKWLLTMQDPSDGGVYNKVSSLLFPDMRMPENDKEDRYVIGKTTDAAIDFAAIMAYASRVFKGNKDYPDFSDIALKAAISAYKYGTSRPESMFQNPSDCNTGEYACPDQSDERFWAACELLITTGDAKYVEQINFFQIFSVPFWGDVRTFGLTSLMMNRDKLPATLEIAKVESKFRNLADNLLAMYTFTAGRIPLNDFVWGGNGQVANSGAILGLGAKLLGQKKYLPAAQYCLDYLLGENTTGYSFVTGFGEQSPKNIHDRRSVADKVSDPLPGYVVGGPNIKQTTDCGKSNYPSSKYAARAYLDDVCSYSTNEIAINWNAPLVLMTALLKGEYKQ